MNTEINLADKNGWGELLGRHHIGALTVLCSGVALYAVDSYVTASLLPNAMDQLGGNLYYSWVATVFLLASIFSAAIVSRVLAKFGPRLSYLIAFLSFGIGMLFCALAQDIVVLLIGRFIQGLGGGLLSGLAYAVINAVFPKYLWNRAIGAISAMWGVGTFAGPALGGIFAQIGNWHGAFWFLTIITALCIILVPRSMPAKEHTNSHEEPFPFLTLFFLLISVLLISLASVVDTLGSFAHKYSGIVTLIGIIAALVFLLISLIIDRHASGKILPQSTYQPTVLKWIYLTITLITISYSVERFVPFFGQKLGNLDPIIAGFLGTVLAMGWTASALVSSRWSSPQSKKNAIITGSALTIVGLLLTEVLENSHPSVIIMLGWAIGLIIAGIGIGFVWPHLTSQAMGADSDPVEANKASAAVSTTQLIANAFGSALTGLIVNLGGNNILLSARMLFFFCAATALLGFLSAIRSQSHHFISI